MIEVKDEQTLGRLRSVIQSTPVIDSAQVQLRLSRAFENEHPSEDIEPKLYRVELRLNVADMMLCGMLSMPDGHLYFDWVAIKVLVNNMIESQLDAFNAGHHWRYKGL